MPAAEISRQPIINDLFGSLILQQRLSQFAQNSGRLEMVPVEFNGERL